MSPYVSIAVGALMVLGALGYAAKKLLAARARYPDERAGWAAARRDKPELSPSQQDAQAGALGATMTLVVILVLLGLFRYGVDSL